MLRALNSCLQGSDTFFDQFLEAHKFIVDVLLDFLELRAKDPRLKLLLMGFLLLTELFGDFVQVIELRLYLLEDTFNHLLRILLVGLSLLNLSGDPFHAELEVLHIGRQYVQLFLMRCLSAGKARLELKACLLSGTGKLLLLILRFESLYELV
jgi:hypothetical protein